jgi:hypothetical protein
VSAEWSEQRNVFFLGLANHNVEKDEQRLDHALLVLRSQPYHPASACSWSSMDLPYSAVFVGST